MSLFFFILSYILLDIIGSLSYVGILLMLFMLIKAVYHMDEAKWDAVFRFKQGKGLYLLMAIPYVIMLTIMFPLSIFWFDLINFEYRMLGSIAIIILLTITGIFKFPKLKRMLRDKYQEKPL
ncbi:hypothetical protein [Virgibacillus sp. YIM 98842]|uniref:hypothetical protein n=1 Tax=Virgibacillus sp. YIM 98842 TaxID=2663533 RepID=UPI0013DD2E78|nr:hypothetical protein [Virgibacillus sp. YIM 98842]